MRHKRARTMLRDLLYNCSASDTSTPPSYVVARAPAARAAACSGRKPSRACGTLAPRWHLPHRTTGLAARLACQACAQCRVHACAPWGRAARHCKRFQRRCAAWHRTARVPPPAPLRVRIADGAFTPAPAECTCVASLAGCSHTSRLSARPCPSPVRPAGRLVCGPQVHAAARGPWLRVAACEYAEWRLV